MNWSNVTQICGCRYSYDDRTKVEIFEKNKVKLIRDTDTGSVVISGNVIKDCVYMIEPFSALLKALHFRLYKHPLLSYQSGQLKLFDNSESCVCDLSK